MIRGKPITECPICGAPRPKEMSHQAQSVFDRVKALREYTQRTGFKTTRSQNDLVQSLDGEDLAEVVLALKRLD